MSTGFAAVVAVYLVEKPTFGTEDTAETMEWIFYAMLPVFCVSRALQDLYVKHQFAIMCSKMDEKVDRTTYCQLVRNSNQKHPCCPGEFLRGISGLLAITKKLPLN